MKNIYLSTGGSLSIYNIVIALLFLLISCNTAGQAWKFRRYEAGLGIGTSQVFGDIGGTISESNWWGLRDINFKENRLALQTYFRYKVDHRYSAKLNFILGSGFGSDESSGISREREYKVTFGELSGNIEYYFVREYRSYKSHAGYSESGMLNNYNMFAAYLFTGLGVTYSHSSHSYQTVLPDRDDYRSGGNVVPVIPLGLGVKYIIDDRKMVAGELGYRYTLSDFVDGYRQRVNSKFNDTYIVISVSFVYRLKTIGKEKLAACNKMYHFKRLR